MYYLPWSHKKAPRNYTTQIRRKEASQGEGYIRGVSLEQINFETSARFFTCSSTTICAAGCIMKNQALLSKPIYMSRRSTLSVYHPKMLFRHTSPVQNRGVHLPCSLINCRYEERIICYTC